MAWWEYVALFVVPLIGIVISYFVSVSAQTMDTEYWNTYITHATYFEYWESYVKKTCSRRVSCGKDCTKTEFYDCSYCDRNPEYWEAYDNIGGAYHISRTQFEELCKIWGNRVYQNLHRDIHYHGLCGKDGNAYNTKFNGDFDLLQPLVLKRTYENRVQCSRSVFNFEPVDSSEIRLYGLYKYPDYVDMFHYTPIVGTYDGPASNRLRKWNALLGSSKQVHMLVLVYINKPVESVSYQERFWKGGNKNEFILCIGINNQKEVQWSRVISWTEQERLKNELASKIMGMPFELTMIVDTMATMVKSQFIRKKFSDFSYIKIQPTGKAVVITFIVTILITIGISIFSVLNPFDLDDPSGARRRV